jgi:hypothetical protein
MNSRSSRQEVEELLFHPAERFELPSQLATLVDGDPIKLKQFCEAYGRLGFVELRECPSDIFSARTWNRYEDSEPLEWIRVHAATVAWCLQAIDARRDISRKRNTRCRNVLRAYPDPPWIGAGAYVYEPLNPPTPNTEVELATAHRELGAWLVHILNGNLQTVDHQLVMSDNKIFYAVEGLSLLETIYQMIACWASGGGELETCAECGGVFLKTDERQRFCPPRLGQEKSPCMNRARVRRARAKKQQTQGVAK